MRKNRADKMNNYLYPFFWQHGETEDVIKTYMDKIHESGMQGVCVEARPHPEFVGDGWWHDMDIILAKAKEHDMKVWILDDSHFPTGYANGRIEKDFPQYRKLYLYQRRFDITGPMQGGRINAGILMGRPWSKPGLGDKKILGVYLAKRTSEYTEAGDFYDAVCADSIRELPDAFANDVITLDVPAGSYSVFVVFTTYEGGEDATKNYLNPLVAEATQVLIDEVYEPHYAHYKDEFGKTITAFFSDEPRFGNTKGPNATIGTDMVLPWREGLEAELPFAQKYLPLLWANAGGPEHEIRFQYMDLVTRLYSENFSGVLARWCNERGVYYLGHNIEDEGAHTRLGYGPGHYFRAQKMQDYAGVDIIGTQIVPGMPYHHDAFSTGGNNGEFYHYALGKLAGSAAHLDPKKKGRAMCEAFGAYGWNEGLKLMKWLADHLISRGINTFVPHAFDPKAFPDWDCAPHFYAHGHNPQFRYFPEFTNYVNRLLTLFNDGRSAAKVGVLYNAKLEWCGKTMQIEKILRVLTEHQIDSDIISEDYLDEAEIVDGRFVINGQTFELLFVPEAEHIPSDLKAALDKLQASGVRVIHVNRDLALCDIATACDDLIEAHIDDCFKRLVYYHYIKSDMDVLFLFNESITEDLHTGLTLTGIDRKHLYYYDAFKDSYKKIDSAQAKIALDLSIYESKVIIATDEELDVQDIACVSKSAVSEKAASDEPAAKWNGPWEVSYADALSYPAFTKLWEADAPIMINSIEGMEDKTGTAVYSAVLHVSEASSGMILDLGTVYETAEVFVNGTSAGVQIAPPYRIDVSSLLQPGDNDIRIEITNTLGTQVRDGLSQYLLIEPFGMAGEPHICIK